MVSDVARIALRAPRLSSNGLASRQVAKMAGKRANRVQKLSRSQSRQGTTMKPRTRKQLFILIAALFLMPTSAALADDGLNDAQIAHIVVTANQVDIDAGKLAQTAAKDPEVKSFAKQMIVDHSGVNKSAAALTNKLG